MHIEPVTTNGDGVQPLTFHIPDDLRRRLSVITEKASISMSEAIVASIKSVISRVEAEAHHRFLRYNSLEIHGKGFQ